MRTVAIIGVGLIGGSFGLALRKAGFTGEIWGVSSTPALAAGLARGAISKSATLQEAAANADLLYLAQPVDRILETMETLRPIAKPACLITDAGSTKAQIVRHAASLFPNGQFLGGHPMAGKEQRGVEVADADLFRDRPYVLTPAGTSIQEGQWLNFRNWLTLFGSEIVEMTAEQHDATVALTSHLPQLVSTALAAYLYNKANHPPANLRLTEIFGSGLLDMTRLALSPLDLWASILATNKDAVTAAVDGLIDTLTELRQNVGSDELADLFTAANVFSQTLRKS